MFYAIFILMYIFSSSNCIRIIRLPDNSEPDYNALKTLQQYIYILATPSPSSYESEFQRRYYMYAMQANPDLFHDVPSNAGLVYAKIKNNVMYNVNIINQGILTYNQWLEVLDIYSNTAFYFTNEFAQARNRIPVKPTRETQSQYQRLCLINMTTNRIRYENAINAYFAQHILPPEEETQASRDFRIMKEEVLRYYNNMKRCQDITWLKRLYNNQILICESYLSYTLRTINNGKMPIPKRSLASIYNGPANFNPFINLENFNLNVEGLIDSNRDACLFMFILVNIKD